MLAAIVYLDQRRELRSGDFVLGLEGQEAEADSEPKQLSYHLLQKPAQTGDYSIERGSLLPPLVGQKCMSERYLHSCSNYCILVFYGSETIAGEGTVVRHVLILMSRLMAVELLPLL